LQPFHCTHPQQHPQQQRLHQTALHPRPAAIALHALHLQGEMIEKVGHGKIGMRVLVNVGQMAMHVCMTPSSHRNA